MTKSNSSSESSKKTTKLSVNPCCFIKTAKSSSSSSSDSSLNISPPIQDFLNFLNPTSSTRQNDTNTQTLQDLLNLTTTPHNSPRTSSPTNEVSFTPMDLFHTPPTSPTLQGYFPSSPSSPKLTFIELLHSNPSPPMESLNDLPTRSSNPPPLSLYDNIRAMEYQNEPHHSSLVEELAYRYARPSIFPQDQGHTHLPSFVFHPVYKNPHSNGDASFRHFIQQQQPNEPSQHFESLFPSYRKIEESLWDNSPNLNEELNTHLNHLHAFKTMVDSQINHITCFQTSLLSSNEGTKTTSQPSTFAPSTSNNPPPTQASFPSPSFPPPSRHDCDHCERTARISEKCRQDIHELTHEMRFILNHILERLESLSHPPHL